MAHTFLGLVLRTRGRIDEAIAAHENALALTPSDARVYYNLAAALDDKGRLDDSLAAVEKAVALDPRYAYAHLSLGMALRDRVRLDEAIIALEKAIELAPGDQSLRNIATGQKDICKRLLVLDRKLAGFLDGSTQAGSDSERLDLAQLCRCKQIYRASVRFFSKCFAEQPALAFQHRFQAACVAVLAAAGEGKDAADIDDRERARLRRQALDWLRADLDVWTTMTRKGTPDQQQTAQRTIRLWQAHGDLAGVRGAALSRLPEVDRAAWVEFWADVAALLKRAAVVPAPKGS
jgi:tetratricopeptide (TPR) repeat protein